MGKDDYEWLIDREKDKKRITDVVNQNIDRLNKTIKDKVKIYKTSSTTCRYRLIVVNNVYITEFPNLQMENSDFIYLMESLVERLKEKYSELFYIGLDLQKIIHHSRYSGISAEIWLEWDTIDFVKK